ncbi:hypothetical protein AMJ50_00425 [Parcubacteria bacterium DG_74_3]|nr:MAG: hypothetical protein AMJ50_00425 [Parcubacteria bacterium DG_74_3]
MRKNNSHTGFTMMEVLAAIFVITTGILGVFSLVQQVISLTTISSSRLVATYLTQEGLEIVRNIRDTNWLQARSATTTWEDGLPLGDWEADYTTVTFSNTFYFENCSDFGHNCDTYDGDFLKINGGFYNYSSGINTKYKRKITIARGSRIEILNISVEVSWEERGRTHKVTTTGELYNWH